MLAAQSRVAVRLVVAVAVGRVVEVAEVVRAALVGLRVCVDPMRWALSLAKVTRMAMQSACKPLKAP